MLFRDILERSGFSNVATGARDPTSTGFELNMKSHSELVAERQRSSVPQQPAAAAKDPLSLARSEPARTATALGFPRAAVPAPGARASLMIMVRARGTAMANIIYYAAPADRGAGPRALEALPGCHGFVPAQAGSKCSSMGQARLCAYTVRI